jgi:cellobiose phosphorylase
MTKPFSVRPLMLVLALLLTACGSGGEAPKEPPSAESVLARTIRNDSQLALVRDKARQLVGKQLTAGSHYPAVFIRDFNTFIELAIETQGAPIVRAQLRQFLDHQGEDGSIVDGIAVQDGATFRATVESDQESSLIQAVAKYVAISGDKAFLAEEVRGVAVIGRLENAVGYLYGQRYSAKHGLVFGATRADWGDVQPEDTPGTEMNAASHPSLSIYDNAMLALALGSLQTLEAAAGRNTAPWAERERELRSKVRTHLWTGTQFIAHVYLDKGSPFPAEFDEGRIYFQGGTAVAIQAGLLEPAEVAQAFARMVKNKVDSQSGSIGVSLYPAYPAGYFKNSYFMGAEYGYQNGGDWPWFGARIVQQMIVHGQVDLAYRELAPMLTRVVRDDGFYEWYARDGSKQGSADYRGTAGELVKAIDMLQAWAAKH